MKHIESKLWALTFIVLSVMMSSTAWADDNYQLTVIAKPTMAGSFNKKSATLVAGEAIQLVAYANSNFTFIQWTDDKGSVVSQQMDFTYVMPARDVTLTAEYEYNPANPANPARNYWNKLTGEVIVDDFTTGQLQSAVKTAIDNSIASEVAMITVAGVMNTNDFGILNTYSSCTLLDLSRVTGVTAIPTYAFDNTNLESVYLPATIESIGNQAFYGCKQLSSMIIYAITPPSLGSNVFTNVPDGLVVYVPASAISLYQDVAGWKNFTFLPIQEDIRNISVSLPKEANAVDYSQMWLELTNTKSGQRMHYVMTDRQTYTFANIIRNTSWNITLRNERGDIFGQIDNVEVKDEDISVTFGALSKPQSVVLSVLTPDGQDVTAQTQVTWTDAQGNYLAQGVSLTGLPVGYQTTYRVVLSQELAMAYNTPQPADYVFTDGDNRITCQLNAIPQVKISGKVKDASTGLPLSGAVISASQTFGGKYSKTLNAKTDGNGVFTLDIANVPTSVAFAASDYISQTVSLDHELNELNELEDVLLKGITGATITLGFTYTPCDGETQNWYSDYQNVNYELFNVTKFKEVSQYNVQNPQIVLLDEVADGDVLRLTATSRTNAFMPVTTTATIAEQKAEATLAFVELGKIQSSFTSTGNAAVVGSLYDSTGKLMKTYNYSEASLTVSDLADGNYTLVSMGSSRLFNTIYDLSQLPQTGLAEGTDYVQNSVEVKSGHISAISISEVPTLDESKLYYTGDNTSFTVNKPSIGAGNYLTLTGRIDFKPAYATNVSNVQMIVDLPESCEFVENSVMVGNSTSSYTLNGHRITIPMARYTDRVRFCVIPTLGGDYAPSAFAQFDLNGETVTQPIGSANYTAKDLSISVPSTVAKTSIPVSGTAIGTSNVEIYDNGVLIGQTTSMANGTWTTTCELNEPYNLSTHSIYAKVTTKQGITLISETCECLYDRNLIQAKTVTMSFYNSWLKKNVSVVFDFENGKTSTSNYMFYTATDITFIAALTNNSPSIVNSVNVFVYTDKNEVKKLSAIYDKSIDRWVAQGRFSSDNLPINIDIEIFANVEAIPDDIYEEVRQKYIEEINGIDMAADEMIKILDEIEDELSNDEPSVERVITLINIYRKEREKVVCIYPPFSEYEKKNFPSYDPEKDIYIKKIKEASSNEEILTYLNEMPTINNDYVSNFLAEKAPKYHHDISSRKTGDFVTPNISLDFKGNDDNPEVLYIPKSNWKITDSNIDESTQSIDMYNSSGDRIHIDLSPTLEHYSNSEGEIDYNKLINDLSNAYLKQWNLFDGGTGGLTMLELAIECEIADKRLGDVLLATAKNSNGKVNVPLVRQIVAQSKRNASSLRGLEKMKTGVKVVGGIVGGVFTGIDGWKAFSSYRDWDDIIKAIRLACDKEVADNIITSAEKYKKWIGGRKILKTIGQGTLTIVGVWGSETLIVPIGCMVGGVGLSNWEINYNRTDEQNRNEIYNSVFLNNKCNPLSENLNRLFFPQFAPLNPIHDPSGYVYEGVPSNRLEGVTATAYYKENVEDMYGDLHENIVRWNAEEYAQENPLFTDENGFYRWDVPQGLWQVKFEKEGYETTYSEWLPVPPPQLDVNIAIKQNRQPEVKAARAYEDAVEVEFDTYMMPELLNTENIMVMQNGTAVEGTVELLNEEVSYEGEAETFASKIRFNAAQPFTEQEITLMVNNRVKSYAGIRMQDNYQQTFTIEQEIKQIVSESVTTVGYSNTSTLVVSVLPASASKGRTLTVKTSSPMILGVETEQVTIGNDGRAEITVSGELPGTAALTFSIEGTDKTAMTIINVEQIVMRAVATPKASIASGTVVEKGTSITLTCETEGATIYYTLDGSCPCNESEARKVYDGTPIIIHESTIIKAMAVAPDMYESDVAEFTYIVNGTDIDDITVNGQIQIYPLPIRDKMNISAGGRTINNVTISSMNGGVVASIGKPATKVTLDVHTLPTGLYIVNIQTEDGIYSQKVMKIQ